MGYVASGEWVAECDGVRNIRSRIAEVANSVNPMVIRFHGAIRHRPIEDQIAIYPEHQYLYEAVQSVNREIRKEKHFQES